VKRRHVRPGDSLDDNTVLIVRGGELDAELIRADARRMHEVYGIHGISVFAVREVPLDELAQRAPLVRFARLTLMTVGALRSTGLSLEATGRNPEHFTVVLAELDSGVRALLHCEHRTIVNPYHES
jgi:hypothetical protein